MPPTLKTLERLISKAGLGSRRQARSWVHARRLTVNGRVVENPDLWVDLDKDQVTFDGKPLEGAEKIYLLLYKPPGYITTYRDPEGRPTVFDLIPEIEQFLSSAGRLDLDTSGLLVMTNDTAFADHLTSPASKLPKTYLVKSATRLSDEQLAELARGVTLVDGITRPATVRRVRDTSTKTFFELTLTEGRNRQVRRMVEAVGSHVLKLVRIAIGPVRIGDLPIGEYRVLTQGELHLLGYGPARSSGPRYSKASKPNQKSASTKRVRSRRK